MSITHWTRRHLLATAAALLLPAGAIAGVGVAGLASAQTAPTYYPLFNVGSNAPQGGDVSVSTTASGVQVTVYLQNVIPNMTYTVTNCTTSVATTPLTTGVYSCTPGTPATITSDATGNATATVTFPAGTTIGTIAVTDPANSGDSYQATISGVPASIGISGIGTTLPFTTLPGLTPILPNISPILP